MDRSRAGSCRPFPRFPRPRGDGPRLARLQADAVLVSPPTRGWTHHRDHVRIEDPGFPAHAGMDRRASAHATRSSRFPRPRGDGPPAIRRMSPCQPVSPPTRGWTPTRYRAPCSTAGFPAHAGMDPRGPGSSRRASRFPRPRGDGPTRSQLAGWQQGVSPPTRGWTAGGVTEGASGFPRPRGDGPPAAAGSVRPSLVSPPTRGWTPFRWAGLRYHLGFPAHAGMDPSETWPSTLGAGFPRPRGDGPRNTLGDGLRNRVSPPTRGWTLWWRCIRSCCLGFPAHAGMDR